MEGISGVEMAIEEEEIATGEASRPKRILQRRMYHLKKKSRLLKTTVVSTLKLIKVVAVKETDQERSAQMVAEVGTTKFTTAKNKKEVVARELNGENPKTGKPETECACQLNIASIMDQVVLEGLM